MENPFKVVGKRTAGDKFCSHTKVEFRPVFKPNLLSLRNQSGQNLPKGFKPANKQTNRLWLQSKRAILLNLWGKKTEHQTCANISKKCSTERSFWDCWNYDQHILRMNHCLQKRAEKVNMFVWVQRWEVASPLWGAEKQLEANCRPFGITVR